MLQVGGKFQLIRNENFWEHLAALGIPEDEAKKVDSIKPMLDITINGKEMTFAISGEVNGSVTYIIDEEVDETIALDIVIKSTASINENQIKIFSVGSKGETGERVYEFYDKELIMTLTSDNPTVPVARRYYQRLD